MGEDTLAKGVFLCPHVRNKVSVATTEDKHFFGTLFGVCFFYGGKRMRILHPYFEFDFFRFTRLSKSKRAMKKYVPQYCQYCELLGICRDEDNNWKCINGCVIANFNDKQN